MTAVEILHRVLTYALVDIRDQGRESENELVFHLAHLFQSVVPEMEEAARGARSYDDVLELLEKLAAERGCEPWLDESLQRLRAVDDYERQAAVGQEPSAKT